MIICIVLVCVMMAIVGPSLGERRDDKSICRSTEEAYADGNWQKYEQKNILWSVE